MFEQVLNNPFFRNEKEVMMIRLACLIAVVSVLSAAAFGADTYFQDSGNHLWSDPVNWDNGVPDSTKTAWNSEDSTVGNYCLIDGASKSAANIKAGKNGFFNSKYVMDEGVLDIEFNLDVAWVVNSDGAIFEMNGGEINIGNKLHIGRHPIKTNVNPKAEFFFNSGVIDALNMVIGTHADTKLQIDEGATLKLQFDRVADIQGYINGNKIVSPYGTRHIWNLDYDVTNTGYTTLTVTADLNNAWDPMPVNFATEIAYDTQLVWSSGDQTEQERLYFGTDAAAVLAGDVSVDMGIVTSPYTPAADLELGQTYYWRVESINNTIPDTWDGHLWGFTVRDYVVVDDFESYTGETDLENAWTDGTFNGTSSEISLESGTDYVRVGSQGMRLNYQNTAGGITGYAEISREFATPQNWEAGGVEALTMTLHGADSNEVPLYVILEDSDGFTGQVNNPDASELIQRSWEEFLEWNIDMAEFRAQSVETQEIKKIYIGLGDRNTSYGVAEGDVYIDDIRLYVPRYIDEKFPANLNADQTVNINDLNNVASNWLEEGETVYAAAPSDNNLIVRYEFEDNGGPYDYTVTDSSSNGFDGYNVDGENHYDADGVNNGCINFDGTFGVVVPSGQVFDANGIDEQITISCWVKAEKDYYPDVTDSLWSVLFQGGAWSSGGVQKRYITGYCPTIVKYPNNPDFRNAQIIFRTSPDGLLSSSDNVIYQNARPQDWGDDQWVHFAFVKDATENVMHIYRNGVRVVSNFNADSLLNASAVAAEGFRIGLIVPGAGGGIEGYHGKMDDFRIYSDALSQQEVVSLAGQSSVYQPLTIPADIVKDNKVDLEDLAEVAAEWSNQLLWP